MNPSIRRKLEALAERHEELGLLLADPQVLSDGQRFAALGREYAQLGEVSRGLADYVRVERQLAESRELVAGESDPEMRVLIAEEQQQLSAQLESLDADLALLLVPVDARDEANLFLEIRAGTGGDEAAIFAGDLFRMYSRYADRVGLQVEILSNSPGEHGGFKEVIARVEGKGAFAQLKFESGTHRVQRVPATEAQGRIHTSACTVAILPELEEVGDVEINPADLKIDTFRASGAGGQHVNKTESAIRILHIPSGVVVECQDERSQHKNRARALSLLKARLTDTERAKQEHEQAANRRLQVGSGDRSQRIRTYNFPQGRLTDHRINLTLYKLEDIMAGALEQVIGPLSAEHRADQLKSLLESSA